MVRTRGVTDTAAARAVRGRGDADRGRVTRGRASEDRGRGSRGRATVDRGGATLGRNDRGRGLGEAGRGGDRAESSRGRRHGKAPEADLLDLATMEQPGPMDPSLLTEQDSHRSTVIWGGEIGAVLEVRHHRMWTPDPRVAPYIARAGFHPWTRVQNIQIDWPLVTALVERWRRETHTFHLRCGEMTITLQDVALLTGLPVDGRAVTGTEQDIDYTEECLELLGMDPDRGRSPTVVRMTWFSGHMRTPPEDADEPTLERYARAYIMCMLASSLLADTSGNDVSLHYLPLLRDISRVHLYSWGSAVLSWLYR